MKTFAVRRRRLQTPDSLFVTSLESEAFFFSLSMKTFAVRRRRLQTPDSLQRARRISLGLGQNPLEKQISLKSLLRGRSGRRPFLMPKMRMMIKSIMSLNQSNVAKRKEESQ